MVVELSSTKWSKIPSWTITAVTRASDSCELATSIQYYCNVFFNSPLLWMPFCDKRGLEQIFPAQITGLPDLGVINILYFTLHLHFLCALVYIIEPAVSLMLKWASERNFFDNFYLFFSSPKRQPTNRGPVRHSDPGPWENVYYALSKHITCILSLFQSPLCVRLNGTPKVTWTSMDNLPTPFICLKFIMASAILKWSTQPFANLAPPTFQ